MGQKLIGANINSDNHQIPFEARIHFAKMSWNVQQSLNEYELGREAENGWWKVDKYVANTYLSLLALAIAASPDVSADTVTDRMSVLARLDASRPYNKTRIDERPSVVEHVRNSLLKDLFPSPLIAPSANTILRFKEKHGKSLHLFRENVEAETGRLLSISDFSFRESEICRVRTDLLKQTKKAADVMRPNFGEIIFNAIVPTAYNYAAFTTGSEIVN